MAQITMYPAKVNSPELSLKTAITTTGQTSIVIAGTVSTKFPSYPNLLVIGTGEDAETIRFTEAPTGNDTDGWTYANVERAFQGSPNTWAAGTPVSRLFTAYDADTFKANIEDLASRSSLPLYAAIVYQSGGYTYAVDKDGNLLDSVTTASKTDYLPIQAAIDYVYNSATTRGVALGNVLIMKGSYYPGAKISNKIGVAVICQKSEYDTLFTCEFAGGYTTFVEMSSQSSWEGGYVFIPSGTTVTSAIFLWDAANATLNPYEIGYQYGHAGYLKNVNIYLSDGITIPQGKAIWWKLENSAITTDLTFSGVEVADIVISGMFEYGIYISAEGGTVSGIAYTAYNFVNNVWLCHVKNGIYTYEKNANGSAGRTIFNNIFYEPLIGNTYASTGIHVDSASNTFTNVYFDDWSENYDGRMIEFTSTSSGNKFIGGDVQRPEMIIDEGTNNIITLVSQEPMTRSVQLDLTNNIPCSTNPVGTEIVEGTTYKFPLKYAKFQDGASYMNIERICWETHMDEAWEGNYKYPTGVAVYTADAGTSSTQIVDAGLPNISTDFYKDWYVFNVTRETAGDATPFAKVTAYNGSTKTLTVSITSQATGDTYYLFKPGYLTASIEFTFPTYNSYHTIEWFVYARRVVSNSSTYGLYDKPLFKVATISAPTVTTPVTHLTATSTKFVIPGMGNTILWELRRSDNVADDYSYSAYFKAMRFNYKTGKKVLNA